MVFWFISGLGEITEWSGCFNGLGGMGVSADEGGGGECTSGLAVLRISVDGYVYGF